MRLPSDYEERVYAGVLGKIIGVYVGSPIEGRDYDWITHELGEINYYVQEVMGRPLIAPDDDISGTLTFVRAMSDYGFNPDLTPAQIGQTWLNYLIEHKTVLWWGGMGTSTEHTAYLRLKAGIQAPDSGSARLNGRVVAEQIGAQIFIDAWGMIVPGQPQRAADLARRAASVSHDGEAIYGAQVIAAMESAAFYERDIERLLDIGCSVIPADCLIYQLIRDVRKWRQTYVDWRETRSLIEQHYGYAKYGGGCHIIPNHALVIMALLYGAESFQRALMIVNTSGWDTDCNSANVGCIMGIRLGLAGIDAGPDYRGPVADRVYISTADGGRTVTDAVHEALEVAHIGRELAHEPLPAPKNGARFHFNLPGAVQGFISEDSSTCRGTATVENVPGHSLSGERSLAIHYHNLAPGRSARIIRETLPDYRPGSGYGIEASPTLYPGQVVSARLQADGANAQPVNASLIVKTAGEDDKMVQVTGVTTVLEPGRDALLEWRVQAPTGCPIAWVGIELTSQSGAAGTVYLDWLTWKGAPEVCLGAPEHKGNRWIQAWVSALSAFHGSCDSNYWLIQNEGTGMAAQGTREWRDYGVQAIFTPHLARSFALGARVQGLKRYYALRITCQGQAQLVRELDGTTILAEVPWHWELYTDYSLRLAVFGNHISAEIDGRIVFELDDSSTLDGGAIALLAEEGRVGCGKVIVKPLV
ncbi:MAG: ADP-ribosylglycohydrolase family protein [Chloroflexi bacterium]|nr:ADP-ribosylglycohydrolase family protein [Chloroflexota bacterium]